MNNYCRFVLLLVVFIATGVFFGAPARASAQSLTLTADRDAWIDSHAPTVNYSSTTFDILGWSNSLGGQARRMVLHFDIDSIPSDATVSSATLNLHDETCTAATNLSAEELAVDWSQGSVTWDTLPWSIRSSIGTAYDNCSTTISFSVGSIVNDWRSGQQNYGILIVGAESGDDWARQISSIRSTTASYRPKIVVNYSLPAPIITSQNVSAITTSAATIYWATANEMSTSIVDYGTTSSYGSQVHSYSLVNSHLLSLSSLTAGTTYHYKVTSTDGSGHSTSSDDATFTTATDSQAGSSSTGSSSWNSSSSTSSGSSTTGNTTSTVPTVTAVSATSAEKPVDKSIAAPTLSYVKVNDTNNAAPIKSTLVVTSGDILKIGGKTTANYAISLFANDKAYTGTADKSGAWEIAVNSSDLAVGDYTIQAQAQNTAKTKGSSKVDLFKLTVNAKPVETPATVATTTDVPTSAPVVTATTTPKSNRPLLYAIAGGIVLLLVGIGLFVVKFNGVARMRALFSRRTEKKTAITD